MTIEFSFFQSDVMLLTGYTIYAIAITWLSFLTLAKVIDWWMGL